jgi:hypothetical protein
MTSAAIPRTTDSPSPRPDRAARVLSVAVTVWYLIAVAGQWLFAAYIVALYGRAVVVGDTSAWTRVMPNGRVEGDGIGNAVLMSHVLLAVIIMIGGPLQLVPWLRSRFRAVHRWTGRAYMSAAITISAGGLYLVWVRGSDSRFIQHLGISLDGVLVLVFSVLAYRTARARHIAQLNRRGAGGAEARVDRSLLFPQKGFGEWLRTCRQHASAPLRLRDKAVRGSLIKERPRGHERHALNAKLAEALEERQQQQRIAEAQGAQRLVSTGRCCSPKRIWEMAPHCRQHASAPLRLCASATKQFAVRCSLFAYQGALEERQRPLLCRRVEMRKAFPRLVAV